MSRNRGGSDPSARPRSSGASCSTAEMTPSTPPRNLPFFGDLHLDQILASLIAGREEYQLAPFFYRPLHEVEAVRYRHHVLRDLEQEPVARAVRDVRARDAPDARAPRTGREAPLRTPEAALVPRIDRRLLRDGELIQ